MPKYLSGRSKKNSSSNLPLDRYNYLSLGDAEPNPGDPRTTLGPSGTGEKSIIGNYSIPSSEPYVVVTYLDNPNGNAIRYWKPLSEGTIPGAVTVFDEGTQVGTSNSITKLNFIGLGITAIAAPWVDGVVPGNIATMTIAPPGDVGSVLFKETVWDPKGNSGVGTHRGDFNTSYKLQFDSTAGILTATSLNIGTAIAGIGGSIFNVTGVGNTALVGIGTTNPLYNLHVFGDVGISSGTIYDVNNFGGNNGDIILKNEDGYIEWKPRTQVVTSAGGTVGNIQFHNSAGFVEGASDYNAGTDLQTASKTFVWDSINYRVGIGSTEPSAKFDVIGDSKFTGITTFVGFTTTTDLESQQLKVSGVSTFVGFSTFKDSVYIAGITTIGNIKIEDNKLYNDDGNLLLEAEGNYVQANDRLYVNNTTESTNTTNGALQIVGGAGIAKNVNVGGALSITGPADATGVAVTLAAAGGITTTGGDLYIGGDLFVNDDIFLDEARVQSLIVNSGVATFHGDVYALSDVGIGTDNPETLLDVYGDGANSEITAQRKDGASILIQAQASLGRFGTNSNDDLQLMSNNAGYLTIKTSGRVGIGTTIPSANLQVDYDEGNSQVGLRLRAYNATNSKTWQISEINGDAGTLQIRNQTDEKTIISIDSSGRVLIGLTATKGGDNNSLLQIQGDGGTANVPLIIFDNTSASNNEILGGIEAWNAGETSTPVAAMYAKQESATDDAYLQFSTQKTGEAVTERLRITSDGKVGIGSTIPNHKLDVLTSGTNVLRLESTDAGTSGPELLLQHSPGAGNMADNDVVSLLQFAGVDDSNNGVTYASIRTVATDVSNNTEKGDLKFFTRNGSDFLEKLRISSDGSVSAGGTVLTESNIYWNSDTYQRLHIFSGAIGGSPGDGVVVAASPFSDPTSQRIGAFAFGCKTSTSDGVTNAGLKAIIEGYTNPSPGNDWKAGSQMRFSTRPDNGNLEERLRIKSDGEIVFPAAGSDRLSMRHKNGGNFVIKNPSAANLSFGTNDDDDELTILNGGNVGIGSTIPDQKLVVNGNIEARGGNWFIARSGDNGNYSYIKNPESAGSALGFFTSGEKMRITSTGDVGIGTNNPIGVNALVENNTTLAVGIVTATHIYSPITGPLNPTGSVLIDENLTVNGNTQLGNDNSDKTIINGGLGIATITPQAKLDVRGNALIGLEYISGAGSEFNDPGITTIRGHHVNSEGDFARLYFANSKSATGSTGFTTEATASIRGVRDTDNYGTALSFYTNNTTVSASNPHGEGSERLRIDRNGAMLYSAPSGMTSITSKRTDTNSVNGDGWFELKVISGDTTEVGKLGFYRDTNTDDAHFTIKTRDTGGSNAERLRITSDGKLLVGATAATNSSIAEFSKSVGSGANGCHVTVENTSTNSVNNTAGIHLKTDQGVAKFYTYRAIETVLQSRAGGTSDLLLYADGASKMKFYTNSEERLRIASDGKVGIGTDDPDNADSAADSLVVEGGNNTGLSIISGGVSPTGSRIYFGRGYSGSDNRKGQINYLHSGDDADSFTFHNATTETLRIDSDGNVGIGTTIPGALLNVYGSTAEIRLQHEGNSSYSRIISDSSNELKIYTGSGPHLGMIIDGSQNVGIGTDNPGKKLDVTGSIRSRIFNYPIITDNSYAATFTAREDAGHAFELTVNQNNTTEEEILGSYQTGDISSTVINAENGWQVGIGTTNPTQESGKGLHIANTAVNAQSRIHLTTQHSGHTATDGFYIIAQSGESGGEEGDVHLQNKENASIKFSTNDIERLRIDSDGNLFAGNVSQRLTSDTGLADGKSLSVIDTTNGAQLHLRGQSPKLFFDVTGTNTQGSVYLDGHDLAVFADNPAAAGTEFLRITSDGDVGIGTTNPTAANINTALLSNDAVLAVGILTAGKIYGDVDVTGTVDKAKDLEINATNRLIIQTSNNATDVLAAGTENYVLIAGATNNAPTWVEKAPKATLADDAIQIRTIKKDNQSNAYLTFVDSNNGTEAYENLYTSTNIIVDSHPTTGGIEVTGIVTAIKFDGDVTGNVTGNADTSAKVYVTDNESTDENNLIPFVADAGDTSDNHALEMDGNLHYNPSTGKLTASILAGNLASGESDNFPRVVYNSAADTTAFLAKGSNNTYLGINDSGNLAWGTPPGTGISAVTVVQTGRNAPCTLPITVSDSSQINIPNTSNAFGAKYIQDTEPDNTSNQVCDGDIWYDTSGTSGDTSATLGNITVGAGGDKNQIVSINTKQLTLESATGTVKVNGNLNANIAFDVDAETGTYTLVADDAGKFKTVTGNITIPNGVFGSGESITIYNNSDNQIAINTSSVTLRLAGSTIMGNRSLVGRGLATLICVDDGATDEFVLVGAGLT